MWNVFSPLRINLLDLSHSDILCPQKVTGPSYYKHWIIHMWGLETFSAHVLYPRQVLFAINALSGGWNGISHLNGVMDKCDAKK